MVNFRLCTLVSCKLVITRSRLSFISLRILLSEVMSAIKTFVGVIIVLTVRFDILCASEGRLHVIT
jgi:hypothetical protein